MTATAPSMQVCAICGDEDDMDGATTCRVCRLDDGINDPALWNAAKLAELKRRLDARAEAHHVEYARTVAIRREFENDPRMTPPHPPTSGRMKLSALEVMRLLDDGQPKPLDDLHDALGCDRIELNKTLGRLNNVGRVKRVGVGLWKKAPVQPKRHRPGTCRPVIFDLLSDKPVTVVELAIATGMQKCTVYHSLYLMKKEGKVIQPTAKTWILSSTNT